MSKITKKQKEKLKNFKKEEQKNYEMMIHLVNKLIINRDYKLENNPIKVPKKKYVKIFKLIGLKNKEELKVNKTEKGFELTLKNKKSRFLNKLKKK